MDFNTGEDARERNVLVQGDSFFGPASRYTVLRVYARAGETLQMGSSAMQSPGTFDNIRVYPPGTSFASSSDPTRLAELIPADPVFGTFIYDCNASDPGAGRIGSRAQELAGPLPNPGGYMPCDFTVPADGIYPIFMLPGNPGQATGLGTVGNPPVDAGSGLSMWDVTVRDAGGVVQPGRLFTHRLGLDSRASTTLAPNPVSYLYTPAGYQYRVSFVNHNGQAWDMAANDRGVVDAATGERTFASFQWASSDVTGNGTQVHFEAAAPHLRAPDLADDSRFPIFFNEIDPIAISGPGGLAETRGYATAPLSPSGALSSLAFVGAAGQPGATDRGSGGTISFSSPAQMEGLGYTLEIDLNGNGSFGDGNDVVDDTGELSSAGGNSFTWNGLDAGGAAPACGSYAYRVRSTLAEAHFTMSDVEGSGGAVIERLSLPGDPALGDPFAASYNDVDPYKGTPVTDTSPVAVNQGTSGPGFHSWSATDTTGTGNGDFVDTWMRLPEVVSSGTLEVRCAQPPGRQPTPGQEPAPGAVSVDKRASDARVTVGETVSYQLVVSNGGSGQASGVVVEDPVPGQLEVREARSTQGDCSLQGNRVRCAIGTLAAGEQATVTVQAVAMRPGSTTNTGIVIAERCPQGECDTDPAPVRIVKPALRVAKTATKGQVRAGATLTYAIRVTNPSKATVRNVRTCDQLPAGLVALNAAPKAKVSGGRHCWTAKRIGAGQSKRYRLTVRALPGAAGRAINRASASSPNIRSTARAARTVRVLPRQTAGGGVTG